jgi:hypothetical protein
MTDLNYYLALLPEVFLPGKAVMIRLRRYYNKVGITTYQGNKIDRWISLDMRSQYRYKLFNRLIKYSNLRLIDIKGKNDMKLICDTTFITKAQYLERLDFRYRKSRTIGVGVVNSGPEIQDILDKWCDG